MLLHVAVSIYYWVNQSLVHFVNEFWLMLLFLIVGVVGLMGLLVWGSHLFRGVALCKHQAILL